MLLWMGLAAYKASPKYNQDKWDVAAYMVDHDGLRPEQVRRDEIDSILSAFDAIEKEDKQMKNSILKAYKKPFIILYDLRIEKICKTWYDCTIKIGYKPIGKKANNHTKRKGFEL